MPSVKTRLISRILIDENGCWIWRGSTDKYGYGKISVNNKKDKVHRVSYREFVREIESHEHLDHLCRVRACCNPRHLEPVSTQENTRRGVLARKAQNESV